MAASVAAAIIPAGAAAADPTPYLDSVSPLSRGATETVYAGGLAPDTAYVLTTTTGEWPGGGSSADAQSDDSGALALALTVPTSVPLSTTSGTVSVTTSDDPSTTLASTDFTVRRPTVTLRMCPGGSRDLEGSGFTDGTYTLSGDHVRFRPTRVTTSDGRLGGTIEAADDLPARFDVTATTGSPDDPVTLGFTGHRIPAPPVSVKDQDFWFADERVSCFAPGERLHVGRHAANVRFSMSSTIGAHGVSTFVEHFRPRRSPSVVGGVRITAPSGQSTWTPPFSLPGTQLTSGQSLSDPDRMDLLTPHPRFDLSENYCNPVILGEHSGEDWSPTGLRSQSRGGCRLTLRRDGDLVLTRRSGRVLWQTGSRGTRGGNRLIVRGDGIAQIIDAHGTVVWASCEDNADKPQQQQHCPIG